MKLNSCTVDESAATAAATAPPQPVISTALAETEVMVVFFLNHFMILRWGAEILPEDGTHKEKGDIRINLKFKNRSAFSIWLNHNAD